MIPDVDLIIQDAQHYYEGVLEELEYWWPKLKPGGTLIIDDYNRHAWPDVVEAAEEFFSKTWYGTKVPTDSKLLIVKTRRIIMKVTLPRHDGTYCKNCGHPP